jgi:hypothetical protein
MIAALPQESEINLRSAKGAQAKRQRRGRKAPKARNMRARGKRRAERGASPLGLYRNNREALKERNNNDDISHFQCSLQLILTNQGRRASRLPLAIIFRAFGAAPNRIPTFRAKPVTRQNDRHHRCLRRSQAYAQSRREAPIRDLVRDSIAFTTRAASRPIPISVAEVIE